MPKRFPVRQVKQHFVVCVLVIFQLSEGESQKVSEAFGPGEANLPRSAIQVQSRTERPFDKEFCG